MIARLLAKASIIALSAAATPAFAQSAVDAFKDEILVTATKKADAENVQDVPLSVTAYGEEQLDALKVRDLFSLTYAAPNVQLDEIGTTPGVANFSVRGLGVNSSIPSIDPTVGVFVDGVYLGINNGVVLDMFDLESIELLRGPQGILFGRNVTGGAVLINTKAAPDEFEVTFKTAVESGFRGTGNNYYAMGSVGGPVIDGVLNAKVAVYYNNDRGWFERYTGDAGAAALAAAVYGPSPTLGPAVPLITQNPRTQEFVDFGKSETWIVRPSIRFTPTDSFALEVRYEHGEAEGDGPAGQNHTNGLNQTNPFFSAPRDTFDFSIDEPGFFMNTWDQVTAEATLDVGFGDGTITNIFGWRKFSADTRGDIDATPLWLFHSDATILQDQLSNEIRYNGTFFDRVDLTLGFYWFTQDLVYDELRFLFGGAVNFFGGGIQNTDTLAGFGQIDLRLSDRFTLNLGARYTSETKEAEIANLLLNRTACRISEGGCFRDFNDEETWNNFTPKIGFTWAATDDTNVYAHWTQGVRSGGYNLRNTAVGSAPNLPNPMPPPTFVPNPAFNPALLPGPFDEEIVDAFEIGVKAQPGDGKATINAAVYLNKIDNFQRELNLTDPQSGVVQVITNTADATIWGIEIDTRVLVTDNLIFTGFLGYADGEYDEILFDIGAPNPAGSPGVVDQEDFSLEIPRLSPFSYGAGLLHSLPAGGLGTLNTRFAWSHRDRNFYTDNNLGVLNEVDNIEASLALAMENGLTFSVYGQNLLNEVNFGGDTQLPASIGGGTFSPLAKGRVVGIELQGSF
jgi:iron complex outermembrane receptor protein